ncbi:MAG: gliding motility-associated C-terminal domain-containing protein [Candidatus Marinimicrobia bacterium]|nr:gliding motility-associated C-terminal domain-containing protein [Candidatus Neomarinimicrobiota bacterium]
MNVYKLNIVIILWLFSLNSFSQVLNLCQGNSMTFNVQAFDSTNSLEWNIISGTGAEILSGQNTESITVKFDQIGDYILQFKEVALSGCFATREQQISVLPNPIADFESDPFCVYDSIKFYNNSFAIDGLQTSIWRIGSHEFEGYNFSYKFDNIGQYVIELSVISNNGCTDKNVLEFNISDKPIADFYSSPQHISTLFPEVEFINLSSDGVVSWDFGDTDTSDQWQPTHTYTSAGWYDVTLILENEIGCIDSITKKLLVASDILFYVPSSFTPDGDDINDTFGVIGFNMDSYKSFKLDIYNRWGECIFSSDDHEIKWDGKYKNGKEVQIDTYNWSVRVTDELGKEIREIGNVTLLR